MKAARFIEQGGDLTVVEMNKPSPKENEILLKVEACGICHSDAFTQAGAMGNDFPRTPGHEVIGIIEELGSNVSMFKKGERVGIGWHGGHCFDCDPCRRGKFINCENAKVSGISYDGGYAEYMTAPYEAAARVPEDLKSTEAAPLLCAGITVFNGMRNAGLRAGDTVAVQGIGGLGHLAIQFAHKMGMKTIALSTTDDKKELAMELGADHFIATKDEDAVEQLQKLGGADLIVATAPHADAISSVIDGLGIDGTMLLIAAAGDDVKVSPLQLLQARKSLKGWPSGVAPDSEDTLKFSSRTGALPMIEEFSLDNAKEGFDKMMNNELRFRGVLNMSK
ncbi:alcohol dehydrogenase/propanol-preferring alcohol dehydrogenase [Nonlabens dokdonensis]|uniref:Zinc-type alcohol dehydrogenase n=2 Tax=Nonlabens dokdonensis TaxID=328515 RepID=L7WE92_NONDD|nr:alcohol dehydrogenase [Nonlabens dokdonensis]AGC78424.1 zinc-type alcohol dehydrogenase [Nonlabens dokdonensis DSW-6]PZX38171.1 alcohol dehydrogenase/propanol-preferring alcohol dehydrogenase [Nonlabens dokdonensis]